MRMQCQSIFAFVQTVHDRLIDEDRWINSGHETLAHSHKHPYITGCLRSLVEALNVVLHAKPTAFARSLWYKQIHQQ